MRPDIDAAEAEVRKLQAALSAAKQRLEEVKQRQTGRSTEQALSLLAAAYRDPGVGQPVHDHAGTLGASRALGRRVLSMACALGLKGFRLRQSGTHIAIVYLPEELFV